MCSRLAVLDFHIVQTNCGARGTPPVTSGSDFAMSDRKVKNPTYYFIDVDVASRQLIGWGTETKDKVEVHLTSGYHRVFLSKGQYNKLAKQLKES